jgi:acetyltransferase-like isoleucine patch superfamily enzyme
VKRLRALGRRVLADVVQAGWDWVVRAGTIGPHSAKGKRFGKFGSRSSIVFPITTLYGESHIWIGSDTLIGPNAVLAAGMAPGQEILADPVISVGDRCLIGRGTGIVGHWSIVIGDDVWTGHNVYITDQNHGYEDLSMPIRLQTQPERPVVIGNGSWIGHGAVLLPGSRLGQRVVVAAGAVVTGELPDYCVAAGNPARVIRRYVEGEGWLRSG